MLRAGWVVVFVAAVSLAAPQAAAAPDGAAAEAMQHFRAGQKHYNLAEFEDALRAFKEAYRIKDDPALLFNIAQCQWKLGDLRTAVHSYRAYLRMSKDPPNRVEVESRILEIENRLKAEELTKKEAPAAETAAAAGAGSSEQTAASPVPTPLPAAPMPAAETGSGLRPATTLVAGSEPATAPQARPIYARWWFWTAMGVVVAAATVGGLLWATRGEIGDCGGEARCLTLGGK